MAVMAGTIPVMTVTSATDPAAILALIIDSHRRIVGRSLADARLSPDAQAQWLDTDAPFGLLAHDTQPDPCFIYANLAALSCFEYPDDELIGMPSRLTAEPPDRDERQRLLDAVAHDGFVDGYRGLRIAKSGRRFWIEDVTVWMLVDAAGTTQGQAAVYRRWRDV
ncbi:MEKHLA domain-containing protein [Beijerinckiaceae bacterium RH AL1]|nr:MEKHLA domain-containing protein [Beijerinckiaceae bacterium RH CH11]VVB49169.1 MEKHLA domain-containing protein [Beijerinckiaceae bacterium RH AL8]VVC56722.1 MEKHLA domain-containing protein [Beijerinckiaceae bacterium RH AL1]